MSDLRLLLLSRHPIVAVETLEEERLARQLSAIAADLEIPLYLWSVTRGLQREGTDDALPDTKGASRALDYVRSLAVRAVFLLRDFHPYFADPANLRALREAAQACAASGSTIVLCSPQIDLPEELAPLAARWRLTLPELAEIRAEVVATYRDLAARHAVRAELRGAELAQLARNLQGLTLGEVRRVVSLCLLEDGLLDAADLPRVLEAKRARLEQGGLLELCAVDGETAGLGGLASLKAWLRRVEAGFSDRARELGLRAPRGVLLVGVQGCGKSLAARGIARQWTLPLVRLEPGRLYDKYVGESEKNLRRALAAAEAMAPAVLWIDEIEKALAGGGGDGDSDAGLGRRLFGSFLTWLQERTAPVFVVATANQLDALPPELLRKGRFDEVFFLDLPDPAARREIFAIHLRLRRQEPGSFDLGLLAAATEGFSGAEIEQLVVSALYGLLAEGAPSLDTARLLAESARTVPLSQNRREEIAALRQYARDRFVPAA